MKELDKSLKYILPVGTLGKLQYTLAEVPFLQDQHLVLKLSSILTDNEGNAVNLAPSELTSLPPMADETSRLLLSGNALSSVIKMVAAKGELDTVLTNEVLSGIVPMTTSALHSVLPQVSRLLPKDQPLVIKIKLSDVPVVSLQNGEARVTLKATIEVLARTRSGLTPLFKVDADIHLVGKASITEGKLGIAFFLERVFLRLISSEIGNFDIKLVENWMKTILQVEYMRVINALNIELPLPKFSTMGYANGVVDISENTIVVHWCHKSLKKMDPNSCRGTSRQNRTPFLLFRVATWKKV
ncbi:BPI fold-containing family B member 4-like [Sceloporus undulatus]|uniref:BPI fold-containing family B member 4-like n=1 Tax=Sceloporus undulatus TaxID=8520 RepID=UPI001C4CF542|nr:BPI fold-containing family B member 4-like [Sceloporus undulatus]